MASIKAIKAESSGRKRRGEKNITANVRERRVVPRDVRGLDFGDGPTTRTFFEFCLSHVFFIRNIKLEFLDASVVVLMDSD